MTLADTNVLLNPLTDDQDWAEWSIEKLADAALKGPVRGNRVVGSEASASRGPERDREECCFHAVFIFAPWE
jgi:hypothetical protein